MQEKKIVLFDLWMAQPSGNAKFHGGGEYIKAVYKHLIENYLNDCELIVFFDETRFLDDWIITSFKKNGVQTRHVQSTFDIQKILDCEKIDVFYSGLPYHYESLVIPDHVFYCGTIHGLRVIELPCDSMSYKYFVGMQSLKHIVKYVFRNRLRKEYLLKYRKSSGLLNKIFCVSQHTKYAIRNFLPEIKAPIEVFYTPEKVLQEGPSSRETTVSGKYILLIGCNRWEKNSFRALTALESLFSEGHLSDYHVVTVGRLPSKFLKKIQCKSKYIVYDYVSPDVLETLYANCDFFVYPTLNEGFGMPPLEAMKYGKTCVTSAICSVPEVCGSSVYYFNPYDVNEIKNRILMAVDRKIDRLLIKNHLNRVNDKQERDLDLLCRSILSIEV